MACPTSKRCLLIGAFWSPGTESLRLPVLRSDNGGENWELLSPPIEGGTPNPYVSLARPSLGCMSADNCVVSDGQYVAATRDGGAHWQVIGKQTIPHIEVSSGAVACPSRRECIVVSGVQSQTTGKGLATITWTADEGRSWHSRALGEAMSDPDSLGCWSTTHCLLDGRAREMRKEATAPRTSFSLPTVAELGSG